MQKVKEITALSLSLGIIVGVVMTAANVYLGLYAGMTVSASIPAAVIGMGVMKAFLKNYDVLQVNIVQTMASAGESLAAGVIFTLPALVLIGTWKGFDFCSTTLIAIAGGLLGVIFMIPLRKALIESSNKELTYPEGVACASVLTSAQETEGNKQSNEGFLLIMQALGIGALFKIIGSYLKFIVGSVELAFRAGKIPVFFGMDASVALLAVGYIVKLRVALLVLLGGVIGWVIALPFLGMNYPMLDLAPLDWAWTLWSTKVRYLGVGAMIVAGLHSIISVRKGLMGGLSEVKEAELDNRKVDLKLPTMAAILFSCFFIMLYLYNNWLNSWGISFFTVLVMMVLSFIFVAVSSYVVGLVGSSNNPVSGMTISALLATSAVMLLIGLEGESAMAATLGVAAVVCCAACTAADCSQDLKTGQILGATPRSQQIAQIIGVIVPAFVIAPVLALLHNEYGIGEGLKAPQAMLFASLTKALFGEGELPLNLIIIGGLVGLVIIALDEYAKRTHQKYRLHLMPIAVGIYLPITLAVPMVIGAVIAHQVQADENNDKGILVSSGLIAGEALAGVLVAILPFKDSIGALTVSIPMMAKELGAIAVFSLVSFYLWKKAK